MIYDMKYTIHKLIVSVTTIIGLVIAAQPVLAAEATIAGTVTHAADGTPVTTLLMYAEDADTGELFYAYTDSVTGEYTLIIDDDGSGTAGEYVVYNYIIPNDEPNVTLIRSIQTVSLADGEDKAGVNFSLTRRARFTGTVYQSDGATPIYSAYVYLTNNRGYVFGYGADYSAYSGLYYVSPAPYPDNTQSAIGEYNVTVSADGYFGESLTDLTLSADESLTTQNFTLTGQSTVAGTVVDQQGAPIVGATVTLDDIDSSYSYTATTDATGAYTIEVFDLYDYGGTAIGNYSLIFAADGYVTRSRVFSITADESASTGNDVTLRLAGAMTGTIYEADGTTIVADATVQADNGLGNIYSTTSAADGTFTFSNLPAGADYTLIVSKAGYVNNVIYGVAVVARETTANQDVLLTTTITLSGRVITREQGDEIAGATVRLFDINKPRSSTADYTTTASTDGTFIFSRISPGHYRVHISQTGYIKLKVTDLDLTTAVSGRNFKLETAAIIYGRVTNSHGEPLHNVYVVASSKAASDTGYGAAYTDVNGRYRIYSLKAGKYTVKFSTTGYVEKILSVHGRKGHSTKLNAKLPPAGFISGHIRDAATDLPLSGYTVRVADESVFAYTDANGYYILDGLPSGHYTVYVTSTNYQTMTRENVNVRVHRETKYVNFALEYLN